MAPNGVNVSKENIAIANHISSSFATRPNIRAYYSDDRLFSVDIATSDNSPAEGICSSSTIGLCDVPLYNKNGSPFDGARIELISAHKSEFSNVKNLLFYISFFIKTQKWLCSYGLFFEDVLLKFGYKGDVKHIYFDSPFIWKNLGRLNLQTKSVIWLYAIPVTNEEKSFIQSKSFEELDEVWHQKGTDIFDLGRASAI